MEHGINRHQIINELSKSVHGDLTSYFGAIIPACKQDPEFIAHLIAWDAINGQIKDTKVALPVISLRQLDFPDELAENSLAHLALQPPRELLKALKFSIFTTTPSRRQKALEKVIRRYLANREKDPPKWFRLAVRHRRSLKALYALTHCPMPSWASEVLFENRYTPGSIFADIANLRYMPPAQAAATITKWHLSPLVVSGAMAGSKAAQSSSAVVQATMEQMSDTELITRAASLEKKGLSRDQALKETFRKRVSKATKSQKATLKTSIAAEEMEDEGLKTMLHELQERQIQAQKDTGRGIDGNWLVIGDKSGSMQASIELAKHIAAAIAKFVSGKVWLAFVDTDVALADVTGLTLEKIQAGTKFVKAGGSTCLGGGLAYATEKKLALDGVAIVSDGGENYSPYFTSTHMVYKAVMKKDLPIYFYKVAGNDRDSLTGNLGAAGIPLTTFDLTHSLVDYYSIPNLVQTMNASRFDVVDKIMACPLITLDQVLPIKELTHA